MTRTLVDTIKADFDNGIAVTSGLGETITITTDDGTEYNPLAVVTAEKVKRVKTESGIDLLYVRTATISKSLGVDFDTATSIKSTMTATISSLVYMVENFDVQHGTIRLDLSRSGVREKTRKHYRGRR